MTIIKYRKKRKNDYWRLAQMNIVKLSSISCQLHSCTGCRTNSYKAMKAFLVHLILLECITHVSYAFG